MGAPYVETDCAVTFEGRTFEAGGAVVCQDWVVAYPGSGGVLQDWHGRPLGTWREVASWRLPRWSPIGGDVMRQIEANRRRGGVHRPRVRRRVSLQGAPQGASTGKGAAMNEVTVTLEAIEPGALIDRGMGFEGYPPGGFAMPEGVWIRAEGLGSMGVDVSVRGPAPAVFGFIAEHWGEDAARVHMMAAAARRVLAEAALYAEDASGDLVNLSRPETSQSADAARILEGLAGRVASACAEAERGRG